MFQIKETGSGNSTRKLAFLPGKLRKKLKNLGGHASAVIAKLPFCSSRWCSECKSSLSEHRYILEWIINFLQKCLCVSDFRSFILLRFWMALTFILSVTMVIWYWLFQHIHPLPNTSCEFCVQLVHRRGVDSPLKIALCLCAERQFLAITVS